MFSETETSGFSTTLSNLFDSIESLRADSTNLIYQNELLTYTNNLKISGVNVILIIIFMK